MPGSSSGSTHDSRFFFYVHFKEAPGDSSSTWGVPLKNNTGFGPWFAFGPAFLPEGTWEVNQPIKALLCPTLSV